MGCSNCQVEELHFEISMEGVQNRAFLSDVFNQLDRKRWVIQEKENSLLVKESGVRELLDFCRDHMYPEEISFRLHTQEWRPIEEVVPILQMQWIDEVIEKKRITSYFQPIVTAEQKIFGYEMLARFYREDGSMIYPHEIFSAARNRGRMYALDRLCRMTAVRNAAVIENKKVFINFIPTSIYSPEFCLRSTLQIANEIGFDSSQLVFEVVETDQVEDVDHLKVILAYYREKGFQYALDDVGEGFSTIELLSELKPQYMKLDMKYVQGVAGDSSKQQTAVKFLDKAIEIGSIPLAEGVEYREDFEWLKQRGYQLFQGYLFGKPNPTPAVSVK